MPEILVAIIVLSCFSLLILRHDTNMETDHFEFMNDYLIVQSETIRYKTPSSYRQGISFNQMGHVNKAGTLYFDSHEVIIHLGNGYATIE